MRRVILKAQHQTMSQARRPVNIVFPSIRIFSQQQIIFANGPSVFIQKCSEKELEDTI